MNKKIIRPHRQKLFLVQKYVVINFTVLIVGCICRSEETIAIEPQLSHSELHSSLSIPSIGEFFSSVDYQINPAWREFIQPVIPSDSDSRFVLGFQMGKLLSDCIHAVFSEDSQQIKNNIREIELFAIKLNFGQAILPRINSISKFCETKNWNALHEELDAIRSEIVNEMKDAGDKDLMSLMDFGAWLRAFQIVSEIVLKSDNPESVSCVGHHEIFDLFNLENIGNNSTKSREIFVQEAFKYKNKIQEILDNQNIQLQDVENVNNLIKEFMKEVERTKTKS